MNHLVIRPPRARLIALETVLDLVAEDGLYVWFQGVHLPPFARACGELVAEVGNWQGVEHDAESNRVVSTLMRAYYHLERCVDAEVGSHYHTLQQREEVDQLSVLLRDALDRLREVPWGGVETHWWSDLVNIPGLIQQGILVQYHISRIYHEVNRSYPLIDIVVAEHRPLRNFLNQHLCPLWILHYYNLPRLLVQLVHICRRLGKTRDKPSSWCILRAEVVESLRALHSPGASAEDLLILHGAMGGSTLDDLGTNLPYYSSESEEVVARYHTDMSMNQFDCDIVLPYDVAEPYTLGTRNDDDAEAISRVVMAEYNELREYIREHCPGLYANFHADLVRRRNNDDYPFQPIAMWQDPENVRWAYDAEVDSLRSGTARDSREEEALSVERFRRSTGGYSP